MDEYIKREDVLQTLKKANIGGYITERLLEIPSEDVISSAKVKDLQLQIADLKRCIKSQNSDYLTGCISALSAVERMITKMLGE